MIRALWLPAAAALAAVGWLGYTVLAPARPAPVAQAYPVSGPGLAPGLLVRHRRPPPRHFADPAERDPEARALAAQKAAEAPEARPAATFLPDGRPRPVNVVRGTPEEMAVHGLLGPLVARHKDAGLPFVRCDDTLARPADEEEAASPLLAPPRDPRQPVCFARLQARDKQTLQDLLREASAAYKGHLAAEVRERLTAYNGRYVEADVRVDTDEPYPPPELGGLSAL